MVLVKDYVGVAPRGGTCVRWFRGTTYSSLPRPGAPTDEKRQRPRSFTREITRARTARSPDGREHIVAAPRGRDIPRDSAPSARYRPPAGLRLERRPDRPIRFRNLAPRQADRHSVGRRQCPVLPPGYDGS